MINMIFPSKVAVYQNSKIFDIFFTFKINICIGFAIKYFKIYLTINLLIRLKDDIFWGFF